MSLLLPSGICLAPLRFAPALTSAIAILRQLDAALEDLNEALRLSPNNRDVRRTLLQVRDQIRDPGRQLGSMDPLFAAH